MSQALPPPPVSNQRVILLLLALASLFALFELLSVPIFYSLLNPEAGRGFLVKAEWRWALDLVSSKLLRTNFLAYLAAALIIIGILSCFQRLARRKRGFDAVSVFWFGGSALLLFSAFTFFLQISSFVLPGFKLGRIFLVLFLAGLLILVFILSGRWGLRRWHGLETALGTGLALILVINFLRVSMMFVARLTWLRAGAALAVVGGLLALGAGLGMSFSRLRFRWPGLDRLEQVALVGMVALGLLAVFLPLAEWAKILLTPGPQIPSASPAGKAAAGARPNVILIVWDTARADHMSLYGYARATTPFLDQLAGRAVVFDRAYSASPWTLPSHASFFTGLYPAQHHCSYTNLRLAGGFTTVAERLREQGYATLAIANNAILSPFTGFSQGFDRFVESSRLEYNTGAWVEWFLVRRFSPRDLQDSGAERSRRILSRWLKWLAWRRVPFFLFLNYVETHIPYPTADEALRFFPDPEEAKTGFAAKPLDWDKYNCHPGQAAARVEQIRDWYDGAIYYLDGYLKELYTDLEQNGLVEHTILIVLSDHGEMLGERDYFGHDFFLYEPLLHVPLVIHDPDLLGPARLRRPLSLVSLPEMIWELTQRRIPAEFTATDPDGPLFAEVSTPHSAIGKLKERCPHGFDTGRLERDQKAVLQWPYKLIWDSKEADELFELETDPAETSNLVASEPGIYRRLQHLLNLFRAAHPETGGAEPAPIDYHTQKALEALGYAKPKRISPEERADQP